MRRVAVAVIAAACLAGWLSGCSGSKTHSVAGFCALAKAQEAQTATFNRVFVSGKPDQLKPVIDKALAQYAAFEDAAPEQIAPAVRIYATDERAFLFTLKNNGYDVTKDPVALQRAVSDPNFARAGQQLTAYLISTCKLGPPASPTPSASGG